MEMYESVGNAHIAVAVVVDVTIRVDPISIVGTTGDVRRAPDRRNCSHGR